MELKRRINDDRWLFKILSIKEMAKISDDKHTSGLCDAHEKIIYIREDCIDYQTIAHEIFHGYFSYLYLGSTEGITLDDAEEISAEFFAAKGKEMVKKAKQLTRELQKLYAKGEE